MVSEFRFAVQKMTLNQVMCGDEDLKVSMNLEADGVENV